MVEELADADLDVLQSLVEKSLVRFAAGRYWMLETIREFASERLAESGEADEVLRRLAIRLLAIGESALLTAESEPGERPELVRPELDNFRRAIDWARDHDPELAVRLAVSLELFWVIHDPFEGARRLGAVLETNVAIPPTLRAQALRSLAEAAHMAGDFETGSRAMAESLAEFERIGDERGIARFLGCARDLVVGLVPGDVFPMVRAGAADLRLCQPALVHDVLQQGRTLRAQGAAIDGMIGIAFHVHRLRSHVLGFIADGVDDHTAAHGTIRTRTPRLGGAVDLQGSGLRVGRGKIKTKSGGSSASDRSHFQKITSRGIHGCAPGVGWRSARG